MKWARSDWILVALSTALGGYCAGMLGCLMFGGVVAALGRWKHVQLVVGTMFCTGLFIVALFLPRHGTVRVQTASVTASPVGAAPASSTETSLNDWRKAQAAQWNQDVDSFVSVHADLSVGKNM